MPTSEFEEIMTAVYAPVVVFMVWMLSAKQLRRWWLRRQLNIPEREGNVRTINGHCGRWAGSRLRRLGKSIRKSSAQRCWAMIYRKSCGFSKQSSAMNLKRKTSGVLLSKAISMSSWGFRERKELRETCAQDRAKS